MYPIITETDTITMTERYFTMPDGVRLYTRIVAPKCAKQCPIVFMRTPYDQPRNGSAYNSSEYEDNPFIKNGYALVWQHCRGTGDSEGICIPYQNEREDGLNSLEIIRTLDLYNGEIYLYGFSYLSTVHLSYLDTNPHDVKGAVLNIQTDRMFFRNYRNGCCYNFCNFDWWLGMMKKQYPNPRLEDVVKRPYKNMMVRAIGTDLPAYTGLLTNDTYTDFWKNDPRTYAIDQLKIPVLLAEGWYDYYLGGMFDMWERLPEDTKARSAFVVGPWGHDTSVSPQAEYPLKNGNIPADYVVTWFNCIRDRKPYPYVQIGRVNYYSVGKDAWQVCDYPPLPSEKKRLYFGKNDTLTNVPCKDETAITYTYDPEKRLNCFRYENIYKAADVGTVDGVTSFVSGAFDEDISVFGKIRWHMNVSSDCDDTAFFIRIYLVENDVAYNLTETITSLSHICPNYISGETVTVDLFTPPIAFTVKKGAKIRADISSDGGIYVPHANVKGHWAEVTETKVANNTVYLKDSFIELCIE